MMIQTPSIKVEHHKRRNADVCLQVALFLILSLLGRDK